MFDEMRVKDLRQLISKYRAYHSIRGYSKMKKRELIDELNRKFAFHDGQLVMKSQIYEPTLKQKKRITPVFVGQLPLQATQPFGAKKKPISNAERRVLERADDLEKYYRGKNIQDFDEYPEYGF